MTSFRRVIAICAAVLLGAAVIAGPAAAHPGAKMRKAPLRAISATALVNAAATEGVTPDELTTAIRDSANARLDKLAAKPRIPAALITKIGDRIANNLRVAMRWSRASTVAANLGITAQQLNDAFRAARKALATKRIDAALAADKITQAQADRLKARLAKAKLSGYRAFFGFGFWIGGFRHFRIQRRSASGA